MGWGIEAVLAIAAFVASLPDAVALVPAMPVFGLSAIVLCGLWLCFWQGPVRMMALPVLAVAIMMSLLVRPVDILIDREARFFALNMGEGRIYMSPGRAGGFERDMWLRRFATPSALPLPQGIAEGGRLGCDDVACIVTVGNRSTAVIFDASAAFDCRRVDYVILLTRTSSRYCSRNRTLVSTFHLWRDGAHAIRFGDGDPVIETVREKRGDRPWSRLPPRKRQYLRTSPTSRP